MAMTKGDVIQLAEENKINHSYSCHSGTNEPCGICISCLEFINSKQEIQIPQGSFVPE